MALNLKQKNTRDTLVADYEAVIKDKQDLIARLTATHTETVATIQNELDELTLKRDGLKELK